MAPRILKAGVVICLLLAFVVGLANAHDGDDDGSYGGYGGDDDEHVVARGLLAADFHDGEYGGYGPDEDAAEPLPRKLLGMGAAPVVRHQLLQRLLLGKKAGEEPGEEGGYGNY